MNVNKLTEKSIDAIQSAQDVSVSYQNNNVEQMHLLYALLNDEGGLIPQVFTKMGIDANGLKTAALKFIEGMPRVTGSGREAGTVYISHELDSALAEAERIAERMKDDYVSVEHLLLALTEKPDSDVQGIFKSFGVDKKKLLTVLQEVRGNQRVTSKNPEETYDVLKKYGQDLVELARQNKLDPVIGRDSEIRSVIRILAQDQEQPLPYRRTRRRQDRDRRGSGSANSPWGRSRKSERSQAVQPGYGRADRGREVSGRV